MQSLHCFFFVPCLWLLCLLEVDEIAAKKRNVVENFDGRTDRPEKVSLYRNWDETAVALLSKCARVECRKQKENAKCHHPIRIEIKTIYKICKDNINSDETKISVRHSKTSRNYWPKPETQCNSLMRNAWWRICRCFALRRHCHWCCTVVSAITSLIANLIFVFLFCFHVFAFVWFIQNFRNAFNWSFKTNTIQKQPLDERERQPASQHTHTHSIKQISKFGWPDSNRFKTKTQCKREAKRKETKKKLIN